MDETLITRQKELKRMIIPLEWDERLKQLHYAKEIKLKAYREELEKVEKEIGGTDGKAV